MSHPEFQTVPVGTDGLHVVQRTHNGEVSYLAAALTDKIGKWPLGLAEGTCKVLRGSLPVGEREHGYRWLPWHTDHLNTKQPASMFSQRPVSSSFCTLGRA